MWTVVKDGKVMYRDSFKDPLTGARRTACVTIIGTDSKANRKLAQKELDRKIMQRTQEHTIQDITLAELKRRYIEDQRRTVKGSTCKRNDISLTVTIRQIGEDVLVSQLTAGYIRERMLAKTTQPSTYNEYIKRLKAMLRWGYDNDYLTDMNVICKIKRLKDDSSNDTTMKPEDKYMEHDQLVAVLNYMEQSQELWWLLSRFLVCSGLRIGEAIALEKSDISDGFIHVNKTHSATTGETTTPKTARSHRDVYIQPELEDVIKDIRRYMRNQDIMTGTRSELFFHTPTGEHISYDAYGKYVRETTEKVIGTRRTPHSFRHTHASILFGEGVSVDTISRRLGHESSKITESIYLHIVEKIREADMAAIKDKRII